MPDTMEQRVEIKRKTFSINTPSIGTPLLRRCISSLANQDCIHNIWIDGKKNQKKVESILSDCWHQNIRVNILEDNVGGGNFYGHRVYAAASFLVNEDVLCYLDEDNYVEPDYIEAFSKVLNTHQWAYTLRNIVDENGTFVCQDNSESLGLWPVTGQPNRYHIDTGCFAIPRSLAVKVGHAWYGQWGADRQFFEAVKSFAPNFGCTTKHTLNYRLGGSTSQVTQEFFLRGNEASKHQYQGVYPWVNQNQRQKQTLTFNTVTNQFL